MMGTVFLVILIEGYEMEGGGHFSTRGKLHFATQDFVHFATCHGSNIRFPGFWVSCFLGLLFSGFLGFWVSQFLGL